MMAVPKLGMRDGLIAVATVAAIAAAVTAASAHPKARDGLWSLLTGPQPSTGCDRTRPRRTASDLDGNCRPAIPPG